MINIPSGYLNVAAIAQSTQSLGPGDRSVVWVQGCPFHCLGCIAPEWIPFRPARLVSIENLVDELLASPTVTGLTFSGGEPMQQAQQLASVAKLARRHRELNIITFSGHRYEKLLAQPAETGIPELLAETDVLIDGQFMKSLNNGVGLRGSSNQRIIHLTSRLKDFDLEYLPRQFEIRIHNQETLFIGIPADGVLNSLEIALGASALKE